MVLAASVRGNIPWQLYFEGTVMQDWCAPCANFVHACSSDIAFLALGMSMLDAGPGSQLHHLSKMPGRLRSGTRL